MTKQVFFDGEVPSLDGYGQPIVDKFVDGKTKQGYWSLMAPTSFEKYGVRIEYGYGQLYEKQPDGRWLLTQGGE